MTARGSSGGSAAGHGSNPLRVQGVELKVLEDVSQLKCCVCSEEYVHSLFWS